MKTLHLLQMIFELVMNYAWHIEFRFRNGLETVEW